MNLYVISDTHFGHEGLVKQGLRSIDADNKLWVGLSALPDDAILIHLGDITLGRDALTHITLRNNYKFKKWLVRGNHDNHSISWYVNNGWDSVSDELVIKMFGKTILFTHCPMPKRDVVDMNIHGHLHGGKSRGLPDFYDKSYHREVTPETIGYTPARVGNLAV